MTVRAGGRVAAPVCATGDVIESRLPASAGLDVTAKADLSRIGYR